ncbi:MAG TPA: rhodanese-like domain-containing protein [Candidatus Ozemobacteraceae bacterium]|nr:rhodanese-like domain-containing protein [Candidatus Ozemobacteraceae bacterium]
MGRVSVHELEKLVSGGLGAEDLLIDVREPDEFSSGHVPGAENIPLSAVARATDRMKGRKRLFMICQRGGRSMQACGELAGHLGSDVALFNVEGGTSAWTEAGFRVEKS